MHEFHLPPGTLIAHYRIRSAIGSGGMGEVYLADDERLGRKVALKILPPEFVRDRARLARFEREAHATSALNHPNILTIYDMGEESGHYFIASEFIEGETLRSRLARRKLKLRDVIEISTQVAGALSAAHAEGVIHRDIKPENIMIRPDGYVKILDFGLAKLSEEIVWTKEEPESGGATVHRPTDPGVVMGTVQYMSPEQAQGEEVDARSDIFSLGVVIYEMITSHLPFEGATKSHVIVSILEKPPLPLHRSAPETPHELQRIVSKCLSKERDERYQVAKDLLIDLRALRHELEVAADLESRSGEHHIASTPRVSDEHRVQRTSDPQPVVMRASSAEYLLSEIKRHKKGTLITTAAIVVIALAALLLPTVMREAESGERIPVAVADFSNQTGQSELDGLSGMLITSLEQSRRLAVMTRSGMFDTLRRLGKENVERIDETLGREICRAENVSALVIASISRFGDLYIVDLKVLDPQKNQYLFTAKEEGKGAESIPSMIDLLSERTRLGLKEKARDVRLSSAKVANVTTTNLEAYHHYFRGQQLINQLKFEEAEEEFRKAVALDPTFALAHYGLAYALGWSGLDEAREPILKAMQYIEEAPEKERYLIRAEKARFVDRNWGQTIAILKQLLERYPDEKDAIFEIGDLSYHKGDLEAAKTYLTKVLEIDPNSERALQHLVWTFRQSGQNAKMLEYAKRYVESVPSEEAYSSLASAHQLSGDLDKGLEVSKRAVELFPAGTDPVVQLVFAYLYKNDYEAAAAEARRLLARGRSSSARQMGYRLLAIIHGYRGEYRAAQATLDEAVKLANDSKDETGKGRSIAVQASSLAWSRLDDGEARKLAAKSLELGDALNIFAYGALFDAYALLRDFESARKIAEEHFSGNPVPLHVLAGLDRLSKGDPSSAIRELENAVRADAANLVAPYFLALAQLEAGQYDQAIDSARRAQRTYVSQGPRQHTYPRTYYLLGKIYERKNDRKAARENYQQFVTLWKHADPDLPELLDAKARLAQLKG